MRLARKVEIQPTPTQRQALIQHAGCARWAYNFGLRRKQEAWRDRKAAIGSGVPKEDAPKVPTAIDLHRELNRLKKIPAEQGGVPWMYESSKCAPQEALRNLDTAFQHFFRRLKTREKPGYPRFKSRHRGIGGFRLTGIIRVDEKTIQLPRIGLVRVKPGDHGYLPLGEHSSVPVTENAGRWYVSLIGPEIAEALPRDGASVGLDLGVVRLATLSDGTVVENPRALAAGQQKIRRFSKDLARKKKGSANRQKSRQRLSRAHARVANLRRDTIHKATTSIAKRYGRVVIEDLKVRNMVRSGGRYKTGLNRVLLDASFGEFRRQLEYKGKLHGCVVLAVPPHYTSQCCSNCGCIDASSRVSQSEYRCRDCGFEINADLNAARNILVAGSCPDTLNACGADVRRPSLRTRSQLAVKQESA